MAAVMPATAHAATDYRKRNARRLQLVLLGLLALVLSLALDVSIGRAICRWPTCCAP